MSINVKELLNNTRALEGIEGTDVPKNYVDNMFAQRVVGPMAKGSIFENLTAEQLEEAACSANWQEAWNENCRPWAKYYKTTDIPGGLYGVIELANLDDDAKLIVLDQKNTGYASLCVEGGMRVPAAETWLIVGSAANGDQVIFTMHPGAPTAPASTPTEMLPVGTRLTKQEAIHLGFNSANVIGLMAWEEKFEETNPHADPEKACNGGGYSQPHMELRFSDGTLAVIDDHDVGDFGYDVYIRLFDEKLQQELAMHHHVIEINAAGDCTRDDIHSTWDDKYAEHAEIIRQRGYGLLMKDDVPEWDEDYDVWEEDEKYWH